MDLKTIYYRSSYSAGIVISWILSIYALLVYGLSFPSFPLFFLSKEPHFSGKLHVSLTKVRGEDLIPRFISIRLSPASAIQSDISFPPSSFDFSHLRADLATGSSV